MNLVRETLTVPALTAATPQDWLASHLAALYEGTADHDGHGGRGRTEPGWVTLDELTGVDGPMGPIHAALVDEGVPAQTAATYLAGWLGGMVTDAIGFALATAGAGFVPHAEGLRLRMHPAGWVDAVDLGRPDVVVVDGHPWADLADVHTVTEPGEVLARAVAAAVEACEPIVARCRQLAPVGRTGLWNEIGDSLGGAVAYQDHVTPTEGMVAVLDAATHVPAVPWRATPTLRFVHSPLAGPVLVVHKGGCCLAYKVDRPEPEPDGAPDLAAYHQRFPHDPDRPRYCTNCSFRTFDDCAARRVFWRERRHATTT